jgi:hypothetical protein
MPIATPEVYADMLDRAKAGMFAYPSISVSSSQMLNAAIRGFVDAGSDRRRGVPVRAEHQGHDVGLSGPGRVCARGGQELRRPHHTPTIAPRTSSTGSSGRC